MNEKKIDVLNGTSINDSSKTYNLILSAFMCAIIAVLSQVAIPLPSGVPVTLQTFAVALCAYFLSIRYSLASLVVYVLLGLVGIPVFSNFGAGPSKLFGYSGGFIWGFILFAVICSASGYFKNHAVKITFGIIGLMVCHLCGVMQYMVLSQNDFIPAFLLVSAPYLVKDIISVVLAYLISIKMKPVLSKIKRR